MCRPQVDHVAVGDFAFIEQTLDVTGVDHALQLRIDLRHLPGQRRTTRHRHPQVIHTQNIGQGHDVLRARQVGDVQLAGASLLSDEIDATANQLAEVLAVVGDPFDVVVLRDHTIELRAVAFTEQQAAAVFSQILQPFEFHWALAIDEQGHFFAQHRNRGKQHVLFPLRSAVGQHHIYPALGGIQQAALPIAQHHDFDLVAQLTEQLFHHTRRQSPNLFAVAPGNRRVDRVVAITDLFGRQGIAGHQRQHQPKQSPHNHHAARLAVNR